MSAVDALAIPISDTTAWRKALSPYQRSSYGRALFELATTAGPLAIVWYALVVTLRAGLYGLYPPLLILAGALLVRMFMIQHDCGHGSFFPDKKVNDVVGRLIGVLTLTPYDHWRRSHALHHATSGNLDRRGYGDIDMLTVEEYRERGFWRRLGYRLYRHPAVMFGLGPAYLFLFAHRVPVGAMRSGWMPWLSTMSTNLGIGVFAGLFVWAFGLKLLLLTYIPIAVVAASIGVWLFYVQHQFPETHWARETSWNASQAALLGSSFYDLPFPLRWFSANIGMHHVHHLSSRVPYYRLPNALRDYPVLRSFGRINLIESLRCPRLVLWDEARVRLISFSEFRAMAA